MQQNKTFILGLGHQKCGTSWLHSYLDHAPNFHGGATKEYHIWDIADIPLQAGSKAAPTFLRRFFGSSKEMTALRHKMLTKDGFYFDYFAGLFSGEVNMTADITPAYCGLSTEQLSFIRDGFATRNIAAKAIIFLRDPLSRIKSATRYNLDRKNLTEGNQSGETDFEAALKQYYVSDHCRFRTNYQHAVSNAHQVFGEENVYVGIFETMFSAREIERLSAFLGVEARPEHGAVKVNKTRSKVTLTDLDADIIDHYSDTYQFCHEHFPQTKELWAA